MAYAVRDLAAWRAKLEARGVMLLDGEPIPGLTRFELRDPFGNRIELLEIDASAPPGTPPPKPSASIP